jgi:ABC-2 type transport system permease protein
VRPYLATFGAALRSALQYRAAALAGVATQIFWGALKIAVFAAFYASTSDERKAPLSFAQVVDYVWLSQALFAIVPTQRDSAVEAMMRDGTIAYELARPVDLYAYWYARALSNRFAATLLRAPLLLLLSGLLAPAPYALGPPASAAAFLFFLAALAFSFLVSAALVTLLAVVAVHSLRSQGALLLLCTCAWLFSGLLLPAPLMPDAVALLMKWLPFGATLDLPVRVYMGQIDAARVWPVLCQQVAWLVAVVLVGRTLLERALSRVVVQGG